VATTNYKKFRLYGYPAFGLLLYLLFYLINPLEEGLKYLAAYSHLEFFAEILSALIFSAIIFETGLQTTIIFNKYLPWQKAPKKRFIIQFLIQIIVISVTILMLFQINIPAVEPLVIDPLIFRQAIILGTIFSMLITSIFTAEYFFKNWIQAQTEASKLKELSLQSQLETLVMQIDPHFLFNNFSTLASLIEEEPAAASKFLSNLSDVYRYILTNKQSRTVPLSKELEILNEYFFLYKKRFGESLQLSINLPQEILQKEIAPITLQILLENALKHNSFSLNNPLHISIFYHTPELMISNNVTAKVTQEKSTGIGLKNVIERHSLLFQKTISIEHSEGRFIVKIPLF
jgi:LytS/YehU family sensor histidine kinase